MKSLSRSVGKKVKKVMNSKHFLLIVLAIIIGGYLLYNWWSHKCNLEMFSGGSKLYFFFADWCGYCKKFKPEWEKLKTMSNMGVTLEEVDCSDNKNTPALAKQYNVRGFPTLILVNGSKHTTYNGERTASSIVNFIKSNY